MGLDVSIYEDNSDSDNEIYYWRKNWDVVFYFGLSCCEHRTLHLSDLINYLGELEDKLTSFNQTPSLEKRLEITTNLSPWIECNRGELEEFVSKYRDFVMGLIEKYNEGHEFLIIADW